MLPCTEIKIGSSWFKHTFFWNPSLQTKPKGQGRHWAWPSGEYCPFGHAERTPIALSQEYPAGQSLQSTPSSVLIKPGAQGCNGWIIKISCYFLITLVAAVQMHINLGAQDKLMSCLSCQFVIRISWQRSTFNSQKAPHFQCKFYVCKDNGLESFGTSNALNLLTSSLYIVTLY